MIIERMVLGALENNTFLLVNEGKAICIDPACKVDKILKKAKELQVEINSIILTHAHFDHIGAVAQLQKNGAKVYMNSADIYHICEKENYLTNSYGGEKFVPDETFDGDIDIIINGISLKIIHTPGHTEGGMCILANDKYLFAGDTLFAGSYGNYTFPGGNFSDLYKSITEKLFALNDDIKVFCGHGEDTFIGFEKLNNMILDDYVN